MTARYLASDFQKSLLSSIGEMDRTTLDFFVISPLVIDCRGDGAAFDAALTATQRDFVVWQHEEQGLRYTSGLARPAYAYAWQQLHDRFKLLDTGATEIVRSFLQGWVRETGISSGQQRKAVPNFSSGIDILLPRSGIRLSYDHSSVAML